MSPLQSAGSPTRVARFALIIVLATASSTACQGLLGNSPTSTVTVTPNATGIPSASATTTSAAGASASATTSTTAGTSTSGQPQQSSTAAGSAVVMPFTGLSNPSGVAVTMGGAVFVTDTGNNRVVKLPGASYSQTVLGFSDLNAPTGISVDNNGNAFVSDASSTRWLWANPQTEQTPKPPWQAISQTEWVGPFSGLQGPHGVLGELNLDYVVDGGNNRVLRWQASNNAPDVIAFTGLNNPGGLAVTYSTSDVWVADTGNNRVLRLQTFNQSTPLQTALPFTGLSGPQGVALDTTIHSSPSITVLYVTDTGNNRVLKLSIDDSAHTATQSILPFAGLNKPSGIATDGQGNVYVVDSGNSRVLKLDKSFTGQ